MSIEAFPPLDSADEDGLLAIGGDLEIPSLLLAYSQGIFPWPLNPKILAWFSPPQRAILAFEDVHFSKRFFRTVRKGAFEVRVNCSFAQIIKECAVAKNRKGQRGTWITKDMIHAYTELHRAGFAHSIECYMNEQLVGGVYGVSIGKMFAAESMFYKHPDASKIALWHLISYLKDKGCTWIDVQVLNPFTESLGAKVVSRKEYLVMLDAALQDTTKLFT